MTELISAVLSAGSNILEFTAFLGFYPPFG